MLNIKEVVTYLGLFIAGVGLTGYVLLDSTYQAIQAREDALKICEYKDEQIASLRNELMNIKHRYDSYEERKIDKMFKAKK